MSQGALQVQGGFDESSVNYNLAFDVTGYDAEKYEGFGTVVAPLTPSEDPLAPLTGHQAMALMTTEMTMGGLNASVNLPGVSGGLNKESTVNVTFQIKLLIDNGSATAEVPGLGIADSFKGSVTGVPLSSVTDKDTQVVTQAANQIKNMMKQSGK
jgi:hypothetical protein